MNKRSFTPSNFDSRCDGDNGKGMKGCHKEGTQKQKVRKVHFAALMDIRHSQMYEYILVNVTKTISSVDISTSTSRGTFARAISSVENSSQAADVKSEKHSQPIHHRGAVHELRLSCHSPSNLRISSFSSLRCCPPSVARSFHG